MVAVMPLAKHRNSPLRRAAVAAQVAELERTMRACGGDPTATAKALGMTREGMYAAAARLGLDLPALRKAILSGALTTVEKIDTDA